MAIFYTATLQCCFSHTEPASGGPSQDPVLPLGPSQALMGWSAPLHHAPTPGSGLPLPSVEVTVRVILVLFFLMSTTVSTGSFLG